MPKRSKHQRRQVTLVERTTGGWMQREARGGQTLELTFPEASISVDELYAGIALEESR